MSDETPGNVTEIPKKRGRKPKFQLTPVDPSRLKKIDVDPDLKKLIEKNRTPARFESIRIKLPAAIIEEMSVNVASLNAAGNATMDANDYIRCALEIANDELSLVLRKHLSR